MKAQSAAIAEDTLIARGARHFVILAALEAQSAVPQRRAAGPDLLPPMFNRYEATGGMHFGEHVDGAVRLLPGTGVKIRTDISATLFLSDREEYDGESCRSRTPTARTTSSWAQVTWCFIRRPACTA